MKADLLIAFSCAAVSAAVLAYLFVRVLFGAKSQASAGGQSALRSLLSLVAVAFERRRGTDAELDRTLTRLEKLVVQAGGKFLEGATAAEVFAARFVFPILALAVIVPLGLLLKLSGGAVFILAAFFAAMMYAYPESGLKSAAQERTRRFTRELPGSLDVMRLVSQSGGDLLSAIRSVIEVSAPGPVREELAHAIAQVAIGSSLVDALNGIAARYLAELARRPSCTAYREYLLANARSAWTSRRLSDGVNGPDWTIAPQTGEKIEAQTAVSAAMLYFATSRAFR